MNTTDMHEWAHGLVAKIHVDAMTMALVSACDELEVVMRDYHTPPEIARLATDAYNAVIRARQAVDDLP